MAYATAWIPRRAAITVILFVAVQDTLIALYNHHLFASTSLCTNPVEMEAGGPFAKFYCGQHRWGPRSRVAQF